MRLMVVPNKMSGVDQPSSAHQTSSGQYGGLQSWQAIAGALTDDLAMFGLDIALPMRLSW